jgi:hypothetical protein
VANYSKTKNLNPTSYFLWYNSLNIKKFLTEPSNLATSQRAAGSCEAAGEQVKSTPSAGDFQSLANFPVKCKIRGTVSPLAQA